ncbi:MAG: adenine deaminase C-terminal domain-containing protein, partial [Chitinophagales bacterium]
IEEDVLKLVVVNRYEDVPPAIAFIKNFGFKKGAIASSVAHDSHNIIAVGVSDKDICKAINLLIDTKGGLSLAQGETQEVLPLPIAGIMTSENAYQVAQQYTRLDQMTKEMGTSLYAPYMTLSFMALLVIPHLKLSDKGLFDGDNFTFTNLFV